MAEISPFRALRYDPATAPLADLVTQPYDKITPEMQERYYAASPYNFVRLVLGKRQEGDDEDANVYTRAAESYCEWRRQGILRADPEPALYVYSQRCPMAGRKKACVATTLDFATPGRRAGRCGTCPSLSRKAKAWLSSAKTARARRR